MIQVLRLVLVRLARTWFYERLGVTWEGRPFFLMFP
jgi:hypothetical protein